MIYVFCNMVAETKKDTKKAVFNSEETENLQTSGTKSQFFIIAKAVTK